VVVCAQNLGELLDTERVDNSAHRRVLLLNLLDGVMRGHLEVSAFLKALPELSFKPEDAADAKELCDVVWITWLMQDICHPAVTEGTDESAVDTSEALLNVTNKLMESQYIDRRTIMEVSEGEFLESIGLISSYKDGWRKREIRANTRNVYAQRKFNLLREETEGYSKVLTLLNQAGAAKLCDATRNNKLAEINSIIGYFDLDPNRVCSLMLDAFAASPENDTFIHLIRNFGNSRLVEMAGFRLASGQGLHPGVYKSIAKLTKEGMIELEDLIGKFSPNEEEYKKAWCERAQLLKDSVQKIGVISLSSSQADMGAGEEGKADQPLRKAGQTAQNIAINTAPYRQKLTGEDGSIADQRMYFLAELLNCGAWDQAILFAKHLKCLGIEDIASFECVGRALCRTVYQELGGKQPVDQKLKATARSTVALGLIQCHLHHDLLALSRVIRLSEALFAQGQAEEASQLMVVNILPAVNLVPANAALCHQLWQVLSQLPCEVRFKLYSGFIDHVNDSALSLASEKLAETEVRRILRRVTAPTNKREAKQAMRPISRLLAKISHANPFVVCKQLLRQVMGMPGMVLSIAESLKYLSPLTFDVMTFMILKQLSCGKRKLKEDGVNLEEWFQWLASFTGLICRNQRYVACPHWALLISNVKSLLVLRMVL
jgi:THO complex subunit 2